MSEIFEGYEHQYCKLSANLSRECTSVFGTQEKKRKLSELKTGLDEAESLKATLLAKLREYKSDLNNLKQDFKKVLMAHDPVASRNELMESWVADHVMLQGVDDNIGKSWQILNTMGRQMTWNKWI
ncbi:unnamed protein product [Sphagnum jensenii]|uniref:Vesicle transport v-SNARE N-terminal domain-containing protein n=1 Tax=Sphagnum jensenii TaxID=128206 RepID=A0ABP1AHC1_9BRYO